MQIETQMPQWMWSSSTKTWRTQRRRYLLKGKETGSLLHLMKWLRASW